MKVITVVNQVKKSAETMHAAQTERIGSPSIGDVVRQGDLYLVCVDSIEFGVPAKTNQLVPGTTQGSRHVAEGECEVLINHGIKLANVPESLIGPAIRCRGEATITHPEHGHKILPADTSWVSVYQRAWSDEIRRVQD